METENVGGASQRIETSRGERRSAMRCQRHCDRIEIGAEFCSCRIRFGHDTRRARRDIARQRVASRGEASVDADERVAIWLVLAMRIIVMCPCGKCEQRLRRRN